MADKEEAEVLAAASKLPLDERVAHSNWKARVAAYEAIKAGCNNVFDPSDPVLGEYASLFPKATTDGNAAALDKALEALQAFLEKASDSAAARFAGSVSSNIVKKTCGARPSTAAKGIDCLMGLVELEQADKVLGALVEGYTNKVPKVVVGALDATLLLIRSFGTPTVPVKQLIKDLQPLFESKDVKARDKVKEIVVEMARWMGPDAIRATMFGQMRDAMKDDVEKLLQEIPAGRPKPERLTRKEAAKAAAAADAGGGAAGEAAAAGGGGAAAAAAEADEPEQVDSYEFADPKDIIPELKKDFWDGLASAKWSERKAALTALKELAAYPHLANGDYADVNREIKKIITKDSNIQVVAEAMNCTANITKGLRRDYKGAAMSLCPVLLEKFKDKASVVNKAAMEALQAMARYCFGLADVAEDIAAALAHQNPKVKEGTLTWLTACMARETKAGVAKLMPVVMPAAAKRTDEGAPSIREAAYAFLVQATLKAGSLATMDKALSCMDEAKRKKLEEMVQEAAAAKRSGAAAPARPAAVAAAASRSSSRAPSAPASRPDSPSGSPRVSSSGPGRPTSARAAPARSTSSSSRPGTSAGVRTRSAAAAAAGGGGAGAAAAASTGEEDEAGLSGALLNATEAKMRLTELIGEELAGQLAKPEWKERLEAMERVVAITQEPAAADNTAVLVQSMAHLPGWDEKNFQVMAKQFEVIRTCAAYPTFTKREALAAVIGGVDKIADIKLKEHANSMLLAAAEAVGPQPVASLLHKRAAAHKNPKVLTETFNWIKTAVSDFLLPAFNVKCLIDWAKEGLGNANSATRTAAVQLLGTLHAFLGPALGDMVRPDLKPALMATVESEFEKQPQRSDWVATRVSRAAKAPGGPKAAGKVRGGAAAAAAAAPDEPPSMDDLLPRSDISGQITGDLVGKLGSANWKERKEGLDEVEAIITAAGGRIQPCVGDLMPALKGRFQDANRNLGAQALQLLASLAKAMGRPIAREARPVLGSAVKCICDSKNVVRAAVIEMLEAWAAVAPVEAPFDEVVEVLPSPKCVSEGMQAAISWMASAYLAGKGTSSECIASAAKAAAIGAAYKTVPVREAAAGLLEAMANALGLADVQRAVQGISDKALCKAASDALAKVAAANGGGMLSAGPSQASGVGARGGSAAQPPRPPSRSGTAASSKAGGAAAARPGSAAGVSRPGTAGSSSGRGLAPSGSVLSRPGTAGSAAAAPAAGSEGALLSLDRGKEERAKKIRFKSSKFEIRHDEVQQLEVELGALAAPGFKANLFAKDFKKQVLAADALKAWVQDCPEEALEPCVASLDLLLRWCVLRLADGNTQTLISVTGMLKALFELLCSNGYRLTEAEVKVFMPGLVEKCGQPQPNVRADCRDLMVRVAAMYSPVKVVPYIQEGLHSKNNRSRVACAEELACLIEREGARIYSGAKCDVLAVLAKLLADSGKEIRAAALKALEVAYEFQGEGIWKMLGNLNGQQKGIVEERFKTVDKDLSKRGLAAGYRKAAQDASTPPGGSSSSQGPISLRHSHDGPLPSAAAAGAAVGGYYAAPGQLSNTAGLINLTAAAAESAAAAAQEGSAGLRRPTEMPSSNSFSLQTGEAGPGSQHPSMLLTGPSGRGMAAAGGSSASSVTHMTPQGMSVHIPDQANAAGLLSAPTSATAGPPKYQPLQSFSGPAEIYAEWDKCLAVLQNGPMDDVIEVMKLLCYEMMELQRNQQDPRTPLGQSSLIVWSVLQEQSDTLVQLLTTQTGQVFTIASAAIAAGPGHLQPVHTRACKYALNTLMNIFHTSRLPTGLKQDTLARMVRTLLLRLVDDNLGKQPEGEALLKALNVLMLKILENSNRNYTFSALLSLLLDTPLELTASATAAGGAQMQQARWADLVVKCLIKSTKALPQVIESIDLHSLLLSIHGFFEALGVDEIRRRCQADDKPLRMVKTILHELCKLKGTEIYRYTKDIPQHGSTSAADGKPVIFPYIDLNIQTLQGSGQIRSSATAGAQAGGYSQGAAGGMGARPAVTPGRPGVMNGSIGRRPPGGNAATDVMVGRLSQAFTRIASQNAAERRLAVAEIHQISQELAVPTDKLIEQYAPDLTAQFKEWLVAELRRHREHAERSAQAQQQQQQAAPVRASSDSADSHSSWQPAQQQQQVYESAFAPAARAAEGHASAEAGAVGGAGAKVVASGGAGGLAALRARMNTLQAKNQPGMAHGSAPGALVGANTSSDLPGSAKAAGFPSSMPEGPNALSDGGIRVATGAPAAAAGGQGIGSSIDEIKNRFNSMHMSGH